MVLPSGYKDVRSDNYVYICTMYNIYLKKMPTYVIVAPSYLGKIMATQEGF